MLDLRSLSASCGVLALPSGDGGFTHLATAWCVGAEEWVSAWEGEDGPGDGTILIHADSGLISPISGWEHEDRLAGFTAAIKAPALLRREGGDLHKRDQLRALGFPDMVDHPAFVLHRGSLDAERYYPYLCPWLIEGHLALFSSEDGWLTGRCYRGMEGGPVLDTEDRVVGVLVGGPAAPEHPPLARFQRLD